jgi:hypothetical protein
MALMRVRTVRRRSWNTQPLTPDNSSIRFLALLQLLTGEFPPLNENGYGPLCCGNESMISTILGLRGVSCGGGGSSSSPFILSLGMTLGLLHCWRDEAVRAGKKDQLIALAFEAGRDGFWLARWLTAPGSSRM